MSKPESSVVKSPRVRKPETYKRWRFQKRIKHPGPKLISSWQNLKATVNVLGNNRRLFGGILLVYAVLTIVFVRGLSQGQLTTLKADQKNTLGTGLSLVGSLFSSSSSAGSQAAAVYQTILLILVSLVTIWALRKVYSSNNNQRVYVKQAFYNATYPFIQFILVLLVVSVQLIPMAIGATIYSLVINNGLAVGGLEKVAWAGLFLAMTVWSLYMVSASIFALFIVTLPDVMPLQALRSAKELVRYRRWTVMRKLLFLPIMLFLVMVIIMLPLVLWLTVVAEWVFFFMSLGLLIVALTYIYNLYRELL